MIWTWTQSKMRCFHLSVILAGVSVWCVHAGAAAVWWKHLHAAASAPQWGLQLQLLASGGHQGAWPHHASADVWTGWVERCDHIISAKWVSNWNKCCEPCAESCISLHAASVHFWTYERDFLCQYCQAWVRLELDSHLAQQAQREALDTKELQEARERLSNITELFRVSPW